MSNRKAPDTLSVPQLVGPRIMPPHSEVLFALFESMEQFAPVAFDSLENDVLLATPEHLRPLAAGNLTRGEWSERLEAWKERFNLHRWQTESQAQSFTAVAEIFLLGLAKLRLKPTRRSWWAEPVWT